MESINLTQNEKDSLAELFNLALNTASNQAGSFIHMPVRISMPEVSQVKPGRIEELFEQKALNVSYQCTGAYRGTWMFVMEAGSVVKLGSLLLNKPLNISSDAAVAEAVTAVKDFVDNLSLATADTLASTTGHEFRNGSGRCSLQTKEEYVFPRDFDPGIVEIRLSLKVGTDFEATMFSYLPLPFAASINQHFISSVSVELSELKNIGQPEHQPTKLNDIIEYCKRIGDFSMIANLSGVLTIRVAGRRFRLGDLWHMDRGSVIEFTRNIKEPVDVLFGDHVIAIADVVTIKDKFGIRIKAITL
jgi:flagellar motor switch protein FliN